MEKCCGKCKWFQGERWGRCTYEIPALPFEVPMYCCLDQEAGWRDLGNDEGEFCPCFTPREEAGS